MKSKLFLALLFCNSFLVSGTYACDATLISKKDSSRCGAGPVNLEAIASAGSTVTWYATPTGGAPLGTGNNFTTPSISTTTTYFATAVSGGGPATYNIGLPNATGNGSYINPIPGSGLRFTVTQTCSIDSVGVYPWSSGTLSVRIWDATTQAVIYTSPLSQYLDNNGALNTPTKKMIYVGANNLPPGNYIMGIGEANFNLTTDLQYEYSIPGGYPITCPALNITGGSSTLSSAPTSEYRFFYDWRVSAIEPPCAAPRQPVVATVKPAPVVHIGNDTTICPGISYTMDATTSGATYSWNTGATTPTLTVNAAGTYSALVTLNGCSGSDTRIISPGVVPVDNLAAETNLCSGGVATLNAGNTGSTFEWIPGSATTQAIDVSAGGQYQVVITSPDKCKITSITNVVIRPLPLPALGNDTSICEGEAITLNAGNAGSSFLWNTGATAQTISISDSGTYEVTITTPYNCALTDNKHIAFLPAAKVEGFDFITLFDEELGKVKFSPLNPTDVNTYDWDFGDGSTHSTQMNPVHVYTGSGQYIVTLKVFNGCSNFSISQPINVNLATGIVTLSKDQAEVMIYPNPASSVIIIDNKSADVNMENVMVFNTLGAMVYQHKADSGKQHRLSVDQLASGMYSVRILTDKGFIIRKIEVIK